MTFWSYGYALGEADESDLEETPQGQPWQR